MSGKRAILSLMKKYEIIKEMDEQKIPKTEIARQHGIPKSTLFTILKMREEIVNAIHKEDELGMFYNHMPDRTLAVKGDKCKGTKRSKERLTVLCCNRIAVTKPSLSWLPGFDAKMGAANRKVDNCPAHPELDNLRNIKLVLLPKITTSPLQPLDQAKLKFREMLGRSMVLKMETRKDMKKWDVFRAMEAIVAQLWRAVQQKTIANCFCHVHFISPVDEEGAVHEFLAAASSEDPEDCGPRAPTWPLDSPSVCSPVTQPSLSQQTMTSQFVVSSTSQCPGAARVNGEEDGEGEREEPAQVPMMHDILKAGDVYAAVLRWHGANEKCGRTSRI
ncbi:hypothetical protein PR048_004133 [Dryococelus australis]|uniref:HTH psq-type domain-containing protein n=1 Tax=Dryococelus australis TaxID=614101 RepID=A0ABQ9I4Q4_9NEOP|nr:hypothetical protein PR048_004133 [Dryococelus australis]